MFLLDVVIESPNSPISDAAIDPTKVVAAIAIAALTALLIVILKKK